jgi:hypothetical protein
MGGLVDDSQISEIGKRMGANYVFVSSITLLGSNYHISCKMIEVQTARIEKQKTTQTKKGTTDIIEVTQAIVKSMFSKTVTTTEEKQTPVVEQPLSPNILLLADGLKVLENGRLLTKNEVRTKMVNTNALTYYNKGIQNAKRGNALLATGIISLCLGTGGFITTAILYPSSESSSSNINYVYMDDYYYGVPSSNSGDSDTKIRKSLYIVSGVVSGLGLGLTVAGPILKSKAKKQIGQAVDMYNGKRATSYVDWNFIAMPNSIRLTLKF